MLLSCIPWWNILICLPILLLMDTKSISNVFLLWMKLLWTFLNTSFCEYVLSLFFGENLGVDSWVTGSLYGYFYELWSDLSKMVVSFYIPASFLWTLDIIASHLSFSHSEGWLAMVWICIFLMSNDVENYFMCLLSFHIFFSEIYVQLFTYFYCGLCLYYYVVEEVHSLYILNINSLPNIYFVNIAS